MSKKNSTEIIVYILAVVMVMISAWGFMWIAIILINTFKIIIE